MGAKLLSVAILHNISLVAKREVNYIMLLEDEADQDTEQTGPQVFIDDGASELTPEQQELLREMQQELFFPPGKSEEE